MLLFEPGRITLDRDLVDKSSLDNPLEIYVRYFISSYLFVRAQRVGGGGERSYCFAGVVRIFFQDFEIRLERFSVFICKILFAHTVFQFCTTQVINTVHHSHQRSRYGPLQSSTVHHSQFSTVNTVIHWHQHGRQHSPHQHSHYHSPPQSSIIHHSQHNSSQSSIQS